MLQSKRERTYLISRLLLYDLESREGTRDAELKPYFMRKLVFMAAIGFVVLFPLATSIDEAQAAKAKQNCYDHSDYLMSQTDELNRRNVYEYLYQLTQDSAKTDLYFRILLNESNLTSKLAQQHHNICGMRDWEKNREYFVGLTKSKYCIYKHWRYSVRDLVSYMDYYGKRAWYFRFKDKLAKIDTHLTASTTKKSR